MHHPQPIHKMNDLSAMTKHSHINGYAPNMHHTIAHKPIIKNKSIGFANKRQVVKYATTKSLPNHGTHRSVASSRNGGSSLSSALQHRGHRPRVHASVPFKKKMPERKENLISFFDIELEKSDKYVHRPGEELRGCIHMDVVKNVEIRFLELMVVGQGCVNLRPRRQGPARTQKDMFLCKRTYVIGTPDSRWTSVLTPGHYVSNFRVKLPKDLPSSTSINDPATGVSFDIWYYLKARICDDVGSASMRSVVTNNNAVKVFISKTQRFSIQRPFDIHLIPDAMTPVVHEEEVILSCGTNSVARFTLGLDRAVFLAGDDIKLQLSCQLPRSQRIKDLTCTLRQHIALNEIGQRSSFAVSEISRHNPHDDQTRNGPFIMMSLEVVIPTQTHLVSSFMVGCKTIKVTYSLEVSIKLQPAGGKVSFTMPIVMGPCAEPIYSEKTSSRKFVPVFNRPVRFPCFSPSQQKKSTLADSNMSKSSQSINVVTVYTNSAISRCFLCCMGSSTVD